MLFALLCLEPCCCSIAWAA